VSTEAWPAPAKINLFLHVLGRRPDGFHSLQTVFQFLDYCDALEFYPRDDGLITRSADYTDVPDSQDLVVRAAGALCELAGVRLLRGGRDRISGRLRSRSERFVPRSRHSQDR